MASRITLGSALGTKLNDVKKAHNAHRADETTFSSGGDLPVIDHGVAQLLSIGIGEYKEGKTKGKPYFFADGVVLSPNTVKVFGGGEVKVVGKRTRIQEPICDTPDRSRKTIADHWSWCLNEIRKLGMDTSKYDDPDELIEAANRLLVKAETQFNFRTWKGEPTQQYPNPRTNHDWGGAVSSDARVSSSDLESGAVTVEEDAPKDEPKGKAEKKSGKKQTEKEEGEPPNTDNIQELVEAADNGDEAAQTRLTEIALANGVAESDIEQTGSWEEVGNLIEAKTGETAAQSDGGEEDWVALGQTADEGGDGAQEAGDKITAKYAELGLDQDAFGGMTWEQAGQAIADATGGDGEFTPEKGLECQWTPKGQKKSRTVEITAVFEDKQTVNLKTSDDNKSFKGIPFDQLSK